MARLAVVKNGGCRRRGRKGALGTAHREGRAGGGAAEGSVTDEQLL